MRRRALIAIAALVVLFVGFALWVCWFRYLGGNDKYDRGVDDVKMIASACRAYFLQTGAYPAKLGDLVHPPGGKKPFLDSEDSIIDPWGERYRYALLADHRGESEVYVWFEQTDDGRLTLHGAKIQTDGAIVWFNSP